MSSKGRIHSPHIHHHPLPGPGLLHHDRYGPAIRPPGPGGFPHFEMLPPPEIIEQKLSTQHIEIEKLMIENQRLAATHGALRQDLATANNELQSIHAHIGDMKSVREQQARGLVDKMKMMEADIKAGKTIKMELQKARNEAQGLFTTRLELLSKVQQLTRDLQMAHSDAQQLPVLMSELDGLRQEYQHARTTFDYEKKLYNDHLESLQVMEKNYMAMSREVDKLRAELTNFTNLDQQRAGGAYVAYPGYGANYPVGNYTSTQNAYAGAQGQIPYPGGTSGAGATGAVVPQSTPSGSVGADPSKQPSYGVSTGYVGTGYDPHRLPTGPNYVPGYYGGPTGPGYEAQWGPPATGLGGAPAYVYDPQKGSQGAGTGGAGSGHESASQGGNSARK